MKRVVLLCGKLFDGVSDSLVGPMEILIEGNHIANIAPSVATSARRGSRRPLEPHCMPGIHRYPRSSHDGCVQAGRAES